MQSEPSSEIMSSPFVEVFIFQTRVKKLERMILSSSKMAFGEIEQIAKVGWFVHLEGSHESIYLGEDEPNLVVGDTIEVRIRRV